MAFPFPVCVTISCTLFPSSLEWRSEWKSCLFALVSKFHMCPWKYFSAELNNLSLLRFQHCSWSVVWPMRRHCFCWCYCCRQGNHHESRSPLLHLFHWPCVILHLLSLMLARNLLMAVSPLFPSLSTRTILNETAIRFSLCLLVVYDLSRPSVLRWFWDGWWSRLSSELPSGSYPLAMQSFFSK